jgi:hypothetical protein
MSAYLARQFVFSPHINVPILPKRILAASDWICRQVTTLTSQIMLASTSYDERESPSGSMTVFELNNVAVL